VHYLAFFVALGTLLAAGRAWIQPVSTYNTPDTEVHFMVLLVPVLAGFCIWALRAHLFGVEKQFGETSRRTEWQVQAAFVAGTAMLGALPIGYAAILIQKMNGVVSPTELVADVRALNEGDRYFPTSIYGLEMAEETIESSSMPFTVSFYRLQGGIEQEGLPGREAATSTLALARIAAYRTAYTKYSNEQIIPSDEEILASYEEKAALFGDNEANAKSTIHDNIGHLSQSLDGRVFIQERDFKWSYGLFALFAGLVVSIFVKASLRTFLLACGAAFLGTSVVGTLSGASIALMKLGSGESQFLVTCAFTGLYFFFAQQAFSSRNTKRFHTWKTVSLTVAAISTPFLPLALVSVADIVHIRLDILDSYDHFRGTVIFVLGCLTLGYLTWQAVYRPRIEALQAQPTDN